MKRVLITGENSYIGTSVAKWLEKSPDEFEVTTISVRGEEWKKHDFSQYDTVFHVAGLVHVKETKGNISEYYEINQELSVSIAKKAENEKVNQFIYLSTMSIYGVNSGVITRNTEPKPVTHYGKSKLKAEKNILELSNSDFLVSIIRPPMVYGEKCPGNYSSLSRLAKKTPVFPNIKNQRSMIYVKNLAEFVRLLILKRLSGEFNPQNAEYVSTAHMVNNIARIHKHNVIKTSVGNKLISIIMTGKSKVSIKLLKLFGSLVYEKEMSDFEIDYNIFDFEESMELTER